MRSLAVLALALSLTAAATSAQAQGSPSSAAIEQAKGHFERAQEAYRRGAYRDAVDELERARRLDPGSKDLEYNLGLVYEKLGDIDQALKHFLRYRDMETDSQELTRIERTIERLRGARDEFDETSTVPAEQAKSPIVYRPTIVVKEAPRRGRLDGFTYAAGGIAGAAAIVGVVFGVRALTERPASDERTGPAASAMDLQDRAESAHQHAVVADVAFLVSAVSLGATAWLYFGRDADEPRAKASAQLRRDGGSVVVGVSF
ncbi:MAG: tetratricopeptide repeat protein [Polyangiaceae bacterium]